MARSDFLSELNRSAKSLGEFLSVESNEWLVSYIAEGEYGGAKIDSIFEVMCYFSLASSLADRNVSLEFRNGNGTSGFRVPFNPANRGNFMCYRLSHEGTKYELCCGTAVVGRDGESKEHPDVSLLSLAGEHECVVGIWDAKYHKPKDNGTLGTITKSDFNQMYVWCSELAVEQHSTGDILDQCFPEEFQVSAVVTNAENRLNYKRQYLEKQFAVVCEFTGVGTSSPVPSRSEILEFLQGEIE